MREGLALFSLLGVVPSSSYRESRKREREKERAAFSFHSLLLFGTARRKERKKGHTRDVRTVVKKRRRLFLQERAVLKDEVLVRTDAQAGTMRYWEVYGAILMIKWEL